MTNWKQKCTSLTLTAVLALGGAHTAFANEAVMPVMAPNPEIIDAELIMARSFEVKGIVEYADLEGGYYAVDGWRLVGDTKTFERYLGQTVFVEGTEDVGMSIFMTQGMVVSAITPISEAGERGAKESLLVDSAAPKRFEVKGIVEYVDLEGGYYAVDGWRLVGDLETIERFAGQTVFAMGEEFLGVSIFMNQALTVESIIPIDEDGNRGEAVEVAQAMRIRADLALPSTVQVGESPVEFDQAPVLVDGVLMLPLRAIVETAGGTVQWHDAERAVSVRLNDRSAYFVIGEDQAEMNQDGHYYLVRNMLKMAKAPVIQGERTLISADALTNVLGLMQQAGAAVDGRLMLVQ